MVLKANFHTHTNLCDGRDTPEAVAAYAASLGITKLGFSGHMDPEIHVDLPAYVSEIHRLEEIYRGRMEIFCGLELDALSAPVDRSGLDYTIGSTHYLPLPSGEPIAVDWKPEMINRLLDEVYGGDALRMCRAYYELEARVYDLQQCTFIGHFDLITRLNDQMHFVDETAPAYRAAALEAMETLVKQGLPFEINCGAVNRGCKKEFYPNMDLLRCLHDMGGEILINSDAHEKELLLGGFGEAEAAALACGFDHVNVLARGTDGKIGFEAVSLK